MPTLPVTVTDVTYMGRDLWGVMIAMADGTLTHLVVPDSVATLEGVRIAVAAMAVLLDPVKPPYYAHHAVHRRYDPRTAT